MCGIVGAVAIRDVVPILMEGLKRLEYRGYDSAGIAVLKHKNDLLRARTQGKVVLLKELLEKTPMSGTTGMFILSIIITSDGSRAYIDVFANGRIAYIT